MKLALFIAYMDMYQVLLTECSFLVCIVYVNKQHKLVEYDFMSGDLLHKTTMDVNSIHSLLQLF